MNYFKYLFFFAPIGFKFKKNDRKKGYGYGS
jgi:hypothetical protein